MNSNEAHSAIEKHPIISPSYICYSMKLFFSFYTLFVITLASARLQWYVWFGCIPDTCLFQLNLDKERGGFSLEFEKDICITFKIIQINIEVIKIHVPRVPHALWAELNSSNFSWISARNFCVWNWIIESIQSEFQKNLERFFALFFLRRNPGRTRTYPGDLTGYLFEIWPNNGWARDSCAVIWFKCALHNVYNESGNNFTWSCVQCWNWLRI